MKYEPNTFYMTVYEKFTAKNGEPSLYTRMMGDGYGKYELTWGTSLVTKSFLKEKVEEILSRYSTLDDFTATETDSGWKYERFVKWLDEDGFNYEIVEEGQHTDHEVYEVYISYFEEDTTIFKKLH